MEQPSTAIAYRPEIDGLRALAVLLVVLFHAGLAFPGGFVGVDIFFVISGFLITSLLLKDFDAGTFSVVGFYERRVRRILPASLVVTVVVLIAGEIVMLPSDFKWVGLSAAAHSLCAANFFFAWRLSNYFAESAGEMPLLHMWSLAVEEQFYLLFPVLLCGCYRLAKRRPRRAVMMAIAGVAAVSLGLSIYGLRVDPNRTFFLLPTRAWELMVGSLLAAMPSLPAPRLVREVAAWLGLAGMLLPACLYDGQTPFPGLAAVPPCIGAAVFIWACRLVGETRQTLVGRMFGSPAPVFIGAISYSLYLYHWPVLVFEKYWAAAPLPVSTRLFIVALSFVAASVSWWFVERPFRRRRVVTTRQSIFAVAGVGVVLTLAAGTAITWRNGFPSRFSKKVNELDALRQEPRHLPQLNAEAVRADRLTPIGDVNAPGPASVLLWGDSHAGATLPAFNDLFLARGWKGRAATHSATTPLLDYSVDPPGESRQTAIAFNQAVVDYVGVHQVKTVFIVNYWERDISHSARDLDEALGRTIAALRHAGATVYVVLQTPAYAIEVPKALAYEAMNGRPLVGWQKTLADHQREQAVMYALAKKYEAADCHFIDPAPFFESKGEPFLAVVNRGRPVYHDAHHLSTWGAKRVFRSFLEAVVPTSDSADERLPHG